MNSTPYYTADGVTLHLGDSLDILPTLPDASVDAIVTDPPYELAFMGRAWDSSGIAYNVDLWQQCWRVLKPGAHLAAFGGTRTYHRMAVAIEDAGFEVRDSLHWIYGSGFPKSLDVSKTIDKAAGAQREVIGREQKKAFGYEDRPWKHGADADVVLRTAPATPDAARWSGFGTALKPAHEPIVLARKPLEGTVAANVLTHGTGALNIDGCRVDTASSGPGTTPTSSVDGRRGSMAGPLDHVSYNGSSGRWPTNVLLGHGPDCIDDGTCQPGCPVADMDAQSGITGSNARANKGERHGAVYNNPSGAGGARGQDDVGGASRFFPVFRYEAKAPASERPRLADGTAHTTVKPLALMRWLVRLVTPPGGNVLDPFAGSGTTLEAAVLEGFNVIGVERDEPHAELCRVRLDKPLPITLFGDIA